MKIIKLKKLGSDRVCFYDKEINETYENITINPTVKHEINISFGMKLREKLECSPKKYLQTEYFQCKTIKPGILKDFDFSRSNYSNISGCKQRKGDTISPRSASSSDKNLSETNQTDNHKISKLEQSSPVRVKSVNQKLSYKKINVCKNKNKIKVSTPFDVSKKSTKNLNNMMMIERPKTINFTDKKIISKSEYQSKFNSPKNFMKISDKKSNLIIDADKFKTTKIFDFKSKKLPLKAKNSDNCAKLIKNIKIESNLLDNCEQDKLNKYSAKIRRNDDNKNLISKSKTNQTINEGRGSKLKLNEIQSEFKLKTNQISKNFKIKRVVFT